MSASPQSNTQARPIDDKAKQQKKQREILISIIIFIIGLFIIYYFTEHFVSRFFNAYDPLKIIVSNYGLYYSIVKYIDPFLFPIYFCNLVYQIIARNRISDYVQIGTNLIQFSWITKIVMHVLIINLPQFVQTFTITSAMYHTLMTPFNYACLINLFQYISKESKKNKRRNKSENIPKDKPEVQNKKQILDVLKEAVNFIFTIKFIITFVILQILAIVFMASEYKMAIKLAQNAEKLAKNAEKLAKYVGSWFW